MSEMEKFHGLQGINIMQLSLPVNTETGQKLESFMVPLEEIPCDYTYLLRRKSFKVHREEIACNYTYLLSMPKMGKFHGPQGRNTIQIYITC